MERTELEGLLEVVLQDERPRMTHEERLRAVEDRRAVRDLIMRYGYLCDARRWDELLELYTDDIERVLAGTLVERVVGKEALREKLVAPTLERRRDAATTARPDEPDAPDPAELEQLELRHLMASDVVRLSDDGTTARAAVQYMLVATSDDATDGFRRGAHEGSYVFDFRKEDGRWRFSRQYIVSDNAHNPMFQRTAR